MKETAHQPKPQLDYDSNPFTLSFKGFGLLANYAKGVLITMVILSLFGFVGNVISSIIDATTNDSSQSSSYQTEKRDEVYDFTDINNSEVTLDSTQVINNPTPNSSASDVNWGLVIGIGLIVIGVIAVSILIGLLISAIYKGFVAAGCIAASEKRNITVGEAISEAGSRFGTLYKAELIATLKIIGGYFLLIVPGVRAQLRYQSTPFIIMQNKEISASEALSKSKVLYKKHLMEVFGIYTVGAIIPLIGSAVSASGMALSVKQLKAYNEANLATPKTHWLNYIGLIIALFFMLIMFLMIGLLIVILINK